MRYVTIHLKRGFLVFGLLAVLAAAGSAGAADAPAVLPIDPVPTTEISDYVTIPPRATPERFGFIDRIHEHCFVISDICRGFSEDAVFRSRAGGPATSRGTFKVGDFVGFRFNINREVEEVWLESVPTDLR